MNAIEAGTMPWYEEQQTTSPWYDDILKGDWSYLVHVAKAILRKPQAYETWQVESIRTLLLINVAHFEGRQAVADDLRQQLVAIVNDRNEERRKREAERFRRDREAFGKMMREMRACLLSEWRQRFKPGIYSFDDGEIRSEDGKLALRWFNEATTQGTVRLVKVE